MNVVLWVPSEPGFLACCRSVLDGFSRTREIDAATLYDLKLALSEACSNAIQHAYEGETGQLEVCFDLDDDTMKIAVADTGRGFDQSAVAVSSERAESGRGLAIIETVMDDLTIAPRADGAGMRVSFSRRIA